MAIKQAGPRVGGWKYWHTGIDYPDLAVSQQERAEERVCCHLTSN